MILIKGPALLSSALDTGEHLDTASLDYTGYAND